MCSQISSARSVTSPDEAIPIKGANAEAPLFLVHCGGGELTYAFNLSLHIDSGIPVYGLPSIPINQSQLRTVEAMAMRMVRMIRKVQPVGPYKIAGWSFGGLLAYEIAFQLIGADQEVEFLGLLDSRYECGTGELSSQPQQSTVEDVDYLLRWLRDSSDDQRWKQAVRKVEANSATMDFSELMQQCRNMSLLTGVFAHFTPDQFRLHSGRAHALHVAAREYRAKPIPILLHLFAAKDNIEGILSSPMMGWDTIVPKSLISVIQVPGTHHSMMSGSNVKQLSADLSHAILSPTKDKRVL
jgi:thioesterase domain-containing protein